MLRFSTFLILVPLLTGCSRFRTIQECAAVIEAVNTSYDTIEELNRPPVTAQRYQQIARAYDRLGKQLAELTPDSSRLHKALTEYTQLLEDASKSAASYAKAIDNGKKRRLAAIEAQAKAERKRQHDLTRRLNRICQP